ncbi:hypothetical protein ATW98_09355 [Oenococcus oeni]|nr:hypothetical protein ATW98_09355 [Oenococcus oeni]
MDDSVFNTAFNIWQKVDDKILADLSKRFLDRKPLKSIVLNEKTKDLIPSLRKKIKDRGFDPMN